MNWAGDFVAVNRKAVSSAQAPFALPELIITTVDLPCPISANVMWRHAKGRTYRSEDYIGWMAEADAYLLMQRIKFKTIPGWFTADIYINESSRIDLDNHVKPLLDYAQSRRLIANDKNLRGYRNEFTAINAPIGARLILREMCA